MKSLLKAGLLIFLIVMLPISFAQNLVYDANGNLVTGDGFYREYNALNQLKYIRNGSNSSAPILEEFEYHPIEERVWIKKTFNASGNVTETVYYLSKEFVMLVNKTGTFNFTYVYLDEQLVAQVLTSSGVINQADGPEGDAPAPQPSQITTTQFILTDHKGSVVVVTNASGAVIENTSYSPYGQIISGGSKSRYDYEGKEFDSVTKTLDFHFRKMNPEIPPWQQPDTLLPNVYDPQLLNRYMFERGNPWKNVDPSGHESIQADGEIEDVIFKKVAIAKEERLKYAREQLYKELFEEYKESVGDDLYRSCIGNGCVDIPDFPTLQTRDLQKNLKIYLDNKGKIQALEYRSQSVTKNQLIERGFAPYLIQKEIKAKQQKIKQEQRMEKLRQAWQKIKEKVSRIFKQKSNKNTKK